MALHAKNLGVKFDSTWVFRGVDFELKAGQRKALFGASGSGKSVMLKTLALLRQADEGTVEWNQRQIQRDAIPDFRSSVMYVPQRTADTDGTVEDYFMEPYGLAVHRQKTWKPEIAVEFLTSFERDKDFFKKSQRDLSGGERQIVALVRALMLKPKVLLLDEPTSAIDAKAANAAETAILDFVEQDSSRAFVWVTHDRQQAERVSTEVVEMANVSGNRSEMESGLR